MSIKVDINGKESSKRKWARILIISGLIMCWLSYGAWVYVAITKVKDFPDIPMELIYIQLGTGLGALGFTSFETYKGKKI